MIKKEIIPPITDEEAEVPDRAAPYWAMFGIGLFCGIWLAMMFLTIP